MEHISFYAMGSNCRIVVDAAHTIVDRARHLVDRLERAWSRFDTDSEVSALNDNAGNVQLVSTETYTLIDHAVAAQRATDGRFNPLMLDQLRAEGYASTWSEGPAEHDLGRAVPGTSHPIALLPEVRGVCIPGSASFDPGGIGKGLCADLVTEFLVGEGATTSSVEIGGDLRVQGAPWYGPAWRIGVAHPFDDEREIGAFTVPGGAVATSSRLKKHWSHSEGRGHHLLDPRTGEPAVTDLVSVSCSARSTWWAEVAAKVVLIAGSREATALFDGFGVHGLAVLENGDVMQSARSSTQVRRHEGAAT